MFMSNIIHNFDLSFGNPPVQQVNKVGSHHFLCSVQNNNSGTNLIFILKARNVKEH
jgi:hypothetical protein